MSKSEKVMLCFVLVNASVIKRGRTVVFGFSKSSSVLAALCLSSVITFYHGACGRAPWRSWSRRLDFSVFANGKWAFSEYISLTP